MVFALNIMKNAFRQGDSKHYKKKAVKNDSESADTAQYF
jgi:hypothetical protein